MATYALHYAGNRFELADARAAAQLVEKVEAIKRGGLDGKLRVELKEGAAIIFVGPTTPVAVSTDKQGDTEIGGDPDTTLTGEAATR